MAAIPYAGLAAAFRWTPVCVWLAMKDNPQVVAPRPRWAKYGCYDVMPVMGATP